MSGNNKGNKEREMEIFHRFRGIVQGKFSSLADGGSSDGGANINRLDELYRRPEFAAEKRILNEMNSMGLWKGVASGLATFAFLRLGPRMISGMALRRSGGGTGGGGPVSPFRNQQSSGYKFDQPATAGAQQSNVKPPGPVFRLIRLGVDTFVSLSVGAYASLLFVDKDKMMDQFQNMPLVEGRSLLSEELCADFTREFQRFDRQTWDANHPSLSGGSGRVLVNSNDGESNFRDTIEGFVANCRRREIYEDELRSGQGMGDTEPVVVPSGGVPRNISVTLDELYEGSKDPGDGDEEQQDSQDDYFDTYFDVGDDDKKA